MFEGIKNWFINGGGDILYYGYAILILLTIVLTSLWNALDRKQKKNFSLIKKATTDGSRTIGKISCFAIKGTAEKPIVEIEYIYTVDNKSYYLCYQIDNSARYSDDDENYYHPDELVTKLYTDTMVYYDKDNPKKAVIKLEAFVSIEVLHQVHAKKLNKYRDVSKLWLEPIDLRKKVS